MRHLFSGVLLLLGSLLAQEQSISPPAVKCDYSPVEVVFLLDITAANKTNFKIQQQRVLRTLKHIESAVIPRKLRFSVVAFHSQAVTLVELASPLANDTDRVATVIGKLRPKINVQTSVAKAFDAAGVQFKTYGDIDSSRIIILAHDGMNTDYVAETVESRKSIQELGVQVFALSGNPLSNFLALLGYTEHRERLLVNSEDTQEFHAMVDEAMGACGKGKVSRRAKGVRIGRAEGKVKVFEEGQDCGHDKVDLVFVLDTSGSVHKIFEDQRQIAVDILESFPKHTYTERLQVSIVRFAATSEVLVPFLKNRSREEMVDEVKKVKFTGQNTKIASAVEMALDELNRGRRKDATQVLALISDGHGQEYWNIVQKTGRRVQESNVEVFAVSAGQDYNNAELLIYVGHKSRLFIGPTYTVFVPTLTHFIGKCVGAPEKSKNTGQGNLKVSSSQTTKSSPTEPQETLKPDPSNVDDTTTGTELLRTDEVDGKGLQSDIEALKESKEIEGSGSAGADAVEGSGSNEDFGHNKKTARGDLTVETILIDDKARLPEEVKEVRAQAARKTLEKFKLRDLHAARPQECDIDLVMILDRSTSVTDDFEREITVATKVANLFGDKDYESSKIRLGAVSFAKDARLELALTTHPRVKVLENLQNIEHTGGSTSAVEGAKLAMARLLNNRRPHARLIIVLLTDGHSQDWWRNLVETSMKLRETPNSILLAYTASNFFSRSELQAWTGNKSNVFLDNEQDLFFKTLNENLKKCPESDESVRKGGLPEEKIELVSVGASAERQEETTSSEELMTTVEAATLMSESSTEISQDIEKRKDQGRENVVELGSGIVNIQLESTTVAEETTDQITELLNREQEAEDTKDAPEDEKRLLSIVDKILTSTRSASSSTTTTVEPVLHGIKTADGFNDKDSIDLVEKVSFPGSCLVDLLFVIDVSTSVEEEFQRQLQFAVDLVKRLPAEDFENRVKVGAVLFNSNATLKLKLGEILTRTTILDSLLSIENTGGSTSLVKGFQLAVKELEARRRPSARQMVVLISDGNSQDMWEDVVRTSNQMRTTGADVYAITVSKKYMFRELELYAGDKWRVYIDARIRQFLDEAEQSVTHCGSRKEEPKEQLSTILEAPLCDSDPVDILIAIDTTSTEQRFFEERQFAEDLLKSLPAGLFKKRLSTAVLLFDQKAEIVVELGESGSREDVIYELERIQPTGSGQANVKNLVQNMKEELEARRRPESRVILVLIAGNGAKKGLEEVQTTFDSLGQTGTEVFAVAAGDDSTDSSESKNFFSSNKLDRFVQEVGSAITKCVERERKDASREELKSISKFPGLNPSLIKFKDPQNEIREEESLDSSCKYKKIDLQLILDASTSREEVFEQQRELALSLIEKLPISSDGTHVAVGINSFTSVPTLRQTLGLGRNKKMVRTVIEGIAYNGGSTLTAQAVDLSVDDLLRGRRKDAVQVVILMNDGISQDSWDRVLEASQRLESTGAKRFGVALGGQVDLRELELYIGNRQRIYRDGEIETQRLLHDVLALLQADCNSIESSADPEPSKILREESSPTDCAHPNVDLLVLFDNTDKSGNMTDPVVNANRYLLLDVLGSLSNTSHVRVSVISFSATPKVVLDFTDISRRDLIFAKVEAIKAIGGMPSYSDTVTVGLDMLDLHRRPDAKATMIIVGDGETKDPVYQTIDVAKRIRETPRLSCLAVDSSPKTDIRTLKTFTGRREHIFDYERNHLFAEEVKRMAKKPNLRNCPQLAFLDAGKRALAARVVRINQEIPILKEEIYSTVGPLSLKEEHKLSEALDEVQRDLASVALESSKFAENKVVIPRVTLSSTTPTTTRPTLLPTSSTRIRVTTPLFSFIPTTRSTTTTTTTSPRPTTPPSFARFFQTRSTEPPPERPTTFKPGCLLDIIIVLDSSGSVEETFRREKELAAGIVDIFRIGPDNARISIIKFAAEQKVKTVLSFADKQSRLRVLRALENIPFSSGTTAIHSAILKAVNEYTGPNGARPGKAIPITIIFTDGFGQRSAHNEAQILRELIPHTYAVAINHQYPISRPELVRITGDEKRVFTDANIEELHSELKTFTADCILE